MSSSSCLIDRTWRAGSRDVRPARVALSAWISRFSFTSFHVGSTLSDTRVDDSVGAKQRGLCQVSMTTFMRRGA